MKTGDFFRSPCGRVLLQVIDIYDDGAAAGHVLLSDNPRWPVDWWEHSPEELAALGFAVFEPAPTIH